MKTAQIDDTTLTSHSNSAYYKRNTRYIVAAIFILAMSVLVPSIGIWRSHHGLMEAIALFSFFVIVFVWVFHDAIISTRLETTPDGRVTIKKKYLWRVVTVNSTIDAIRGSYVFWKYNDAESGMAINALKVLMRDGTKIDLELGELPQMINLGRQLQSRCGIPYLAD